MEQSSHGKSDEADLYALGEIEKLPGSRALGRTLLDERRVLDTAPEQQEKQNQSRDAQIDGIFQVDFVDFMPGGASLRIQRQDVAPDARANERVRQNESDGRNRLVPPQLRRSGGI